MKRFALLLLVLLLAAFCESLMTASSAYAVACSVKAKKGTPQSDLEKLAKITKDQAQKKAIASIKAKEKPDVAEGELELERGCVVYSFDLREPGKKGVSEVIVDAGTGKILARKHESEKKEAAEKASEKH